MSVHLWRRILFQVSTTIEDTLSIYIYIYIIQQLVIKCRFSESTLLNYAYLVEIGPSNASQGQQWRKDATEQIKNMTLAGSRTQVPGFSIADTKTTKPRVPVAVPEFLYLYAFRS